MTTNLDLSSIVLIWSILLFVLGMIYTRELWYHPRSKSRGAHAAGRGKHKHA